jgi:hypothetical protein
MFGRNASNSTEILPKFFDLQSVVLDLVFVDGHAPARISGCGAVPLIAVWFNW